MESNTSSTEEVEKGANSSGAEKRQVMREPSNPMSVHSSEGSKVEGVKSSVQVRGRNNISVKISSLLQAYKEKTKRLCTVPSDRFIIFLFHMGFRHTNCLVNCRRD